MAANPVTRHTADREDGERWTPADKWQAIARNLAQVLDGVADELAEVEARGSLIFVDDLQCKHAILRGVFKRQCEAHGMVV